MTMKSSGWAFLFWFGCFFGLAGLHRFYLGRYVTGVIWLLTWGLFGIGQFIDLFLINGMVREENGRDPDTVMARALTRMVGQPQAAGHAPT